MSKPMQVDVLLSHSESLPVVDVWLIIDILRASTVMTRWFELGGEELYPAVSVDEARVLAAAMRSDGKSLVLMGEQNGIAPEGFDLGNSPLDLTEDLVRRCPCAVMATTNGTKALMKASLTGTPVLAACARNAGAAVELALAKGSRIGIFCSGRKGRPAWDDTLCAGLLVSYIQSRCPAIRLADSARLALLTFRSYDNFADSLAAADHAVFLDKIGFRGDIEFASQIDAASSVPELHELPDGDKMRVVLREGLSAEMRAREWQRPEPLRIVNVAERLPIVPELSLPEETHIFLPGENFKRQRRSRQRRS